MTFKVFETINGKFLYDRQENRIVKIDEEDFLSFQEMKTEGMNDGIKNVLERFHERGLCKDNELVNIEHPQTASLEFFLNEHLDQVTLQVTQNCNLRCSYCAYSGKYNNRVHTKKKMSYETACKAIDYLVKHSRNSKKCIVAFYGGEPLLEIDLIKKVVDYTETNCEGKEITYMLTTNATLLSDDIVDYLVEKNFIIMISIDGPKNIHDSNRCFRNGKGSHDIVMNNLSRIKSRYPEFYRNCSTNTVISPEQDFMCVENFLVKDDVMKSLLTRLSLISDTGTNDQFHYEDTLLIEQRKEVLKHMLYMLGELDEKTEPLFGDFENDINRKYSALHSGSLHSKKGHPSGPCIAGAKKTFISADGEIYPCEKVPECEEMSLGNINSGFIINKAKDMLNIARITERQCKNCWAFIFCFSCVVTCIDESGISAEKRINKCDGVRGTALEALKNITRLREYGYNFDKY